MNNTFSASYKYLIAQPTGPGEFRYLIERRPGLNTWTYDFDRAAKYKHRTHAELVLTEVQSDAPCAVIIPVKVTLEVLTAFAR